MATIKIYLAGGMRNDWRQLVIDEIDPTFVEFLDPCSHSLKTESAYTYWDINAINESDIVFAYMEVDNPSGAGLAFEIGYAVAKDAKVIFVDESSDEVSRYFGMCRVASTVYVPSLPEGINMLRHIIRILRTNTR